MELQANSSTPRRAPRLYLVSDRRQTARPLAAVVAAAVAGGVDAVQLREKDLGAGELARLADTLLGVTQTADVPLLVNDRIDVALACGARGVQLAGTSLEVARARALVGPARLIGVSTHGVDAAVAAARDGADFVVFGPLFATPSKAAYGAPQGLARLREVCRQTPCPVIAIGGIKAHNVAAVLEAGAYGVAVISAILASADPQAAAARLVELVRRHLARRAPMP